MRRSTNSTPATWPTASLTPSSLRRTAQRGRLTLKPQADFRDSLSLHKLRDTPLRCLLRVPCAPSATSTSVTRKSVITALCRCNVQGQRGGCRAKFGECQIFYARQRFYRAMGSLRGGVSAYSEGSEGASQKRASARWGVCKATTGASPRTPELPHSSVVTSRNPLQIERICRTGPARDAKFACKSNF